MGNKIAIGLAAAALVVSVFGSTSVGRAALDAIPVPLAKRAYLADTAKNAIRVNNIRASRTPTAGMLLPLDSTGKLPASIGAVGLKGDKGNKGDDGDKGSPGVSGYEIVTVTGAVRSTTGVFDVVTAACPTGKKVLGGGAYTVPLSGTYYDNVAVESSYPISDTQWQAVASVVNPPAAPGTWRLITYAICANVTS